MKKRQVPILYWFFLSFVMAVLPAMVFAYPIGVGVYIAVFALSGGPGGEASETSKMFAEAICAPSGLFYLFSNNPNPGGNLSTSILILGFPQGWILFTVLLSLLGFTRLNRKRTDGEIEEDISVSKKRD